MRTRSPLEPLAILSGLAAALLAACTLEPLPVHPSRVQVARNEAKPLRTGPGAPGAVKLQWDFARAEGYVFDPGKIELSGGFARLKKLEKTVVAYSTGRSTIETGHGKIFAVLESFTEKLGPGNRGSVKYQLSPDGYKWFFHNGKRWVRAEAPSVDQANDAAAINRAAPAFHAEAGVGHVFWRAFLISPTGAEPVELEKVEIAAIEAPMDFWD